MSDLRIFFDERNAEVEEFFNFLNEINSNPSYSSTMPILKSQAILMLYNLIEGSVNRGIEYIFDTIGDNTLKHNEVSNKIQIMWLRYFKLHLDNKGDSQNTLEDIFKFVNDNVEIDISKFRKSNSSYFSSGTLDSASIKEILKKFSIECNFFEHQLKNIKEERNFLAHGEKSFTEISQNKQLSEVENIKEKVINFLENYINVIESYIDMEKYKL